jgi:hypothetical protein
VHLVRRSGVGEWVTHLSVDGGRKVTMARNDVEARLHALTTTLVNELISLTPETMTEIQFEIAMTDDGGADIGLLENHPDATRVALSDLIYTTASHYLPLIKQYVPGWTRTLISLQESKGGWQVKVDFEHL